MTKPPAMMQAYWAVIREHAVGCDIHSYGERREGNRWVCVRAAVSPPWFEYEERMGGDPDPSGPEPFDEYCKYRGFAFLGGIRNQWGVPPIVEPRGLPADPSTYVRYEYWNDERHDDWRDNWHSQSWLTVEELTGFDYDRSFEFVDDAGDSHAKQTKTYREFLGPEFMNRIDALKAAGIERVVFWFDN